MPSHGRRLVDRRFASDLCLYDTFTLTRDSKTEMRVISTPRVHTNVVGGRKYLMVRVSANQAEGIGDMILDPWKLVFIHRKGKAT